MIQPPAAPPWDDHGNDPLRLPQQVLAQMALIPPVHVEPRPLGKAQGEEKWGGQVMQAARAQVHLVDELPVVQQEVEL